MREREGGREREREREREGGRERGRERERERELECIHQSKMNPNQLHAKIIYTMMGINQNF